MNSYGIQGGSPGGTGVYGFSTSSTVIYTWSSSGPALVANGHVQGAVFVVLDQRFLTLTYPLITSREKNHEQPAWQYNSPPPTRYVY